MQLKRTTKALTSARAIELAARCAEKQISRLGDSCAALAEDAIQEARIAVWEHFRKHRWISPALIGQISFRAIVDCLRRLRGRPKTAGARFKRPQHLSSEHMARMTYHDRAMQRHEFREELALAQNGMPPRSRRSFKLFCEGHRPMAIARILKRSRGSVDDDLWEARRACRKVFT